MAAPTRGTSVVTESTGTNTAVCNLPATIAADDRLLLVICIDTQVTVSAVSDSTSDSWSILGQQHDTGGAGRFTLCLAEKIADGDEDSGTVTVTHNGGSETFVGIVCPITGAHATQAMELGSFSVVAASTTSTPDAPVSATASWGAEDNLVVTALAWENNADTAAAPSGYDFNTTRGTDWEEGTTSADAACAVASKELTAADSDDPGTWSMGDDRSWVLVTGILRPAAAAGGIDPAVAAYHHNYHNLR